MLLLHLRSKHENLSVEVLNKKTTGRCRAKTVEWCLGKFRHKNLLTKADFTIQIEEIKIGR